MSDSPAPEPAIELTEAEIDGVEAMLGYREREGLEAEELASGPAAEALGTEPGLAARAAADRVSPRAFRMIVDYETGGRAFYERVLKSRPIWPKAASGVTIGFGYDLGYVTAAEYQRDWADLIGGLRDSHVRALAACVGFHGGKDPDARMEALVKSVADIVVGWDLSEAVYRARTLPKFALMTESALPNASRLGGDAFGALVSLTFNRGAPYSKAHDPGKDPLDRYREMRAIKADMAVRNFDDIPRQIRAMIRIWKGTKIEEGMRRRRTDEAALFLDGLAAGPAIAALDAEATAEPPAAMAATALGPEVESTNGPSDEDFWDDVTEDDVAAAALDGYSVGIAATGATWAPDEVQPDYMHLGSGLPRNVPFPLTADDLALLARLNDFPMDGAGDAPVLFGLRGAGIVKAHDDPGGIVLLDQRPDHTLPRCTIGVWDRARGTVAVFPGSTVPNQAAVASFKAKREAGNLLSTGLYHYVCGAHTTARRSTPGCFLLRKPDMSKRVVIVRRSVDDLSYQTTDIVDRCAPGDNIHPGFFSQPSGFSSLGCQTVVGTFKDGVHSGPWAAFRRAAGFNDTDGVPGKPFLYMLLTGTEARLAARLRLEGLAGDTVALARLRRLRFGSKGAATRRLQEKLSLPEPDGAMGSFSAERFHRFQASRPGARGSDGIFTPALDAALGWEVFGAVGV